MIHNNNGSRVMNFTLDMQIELAYKFARMNDAQFRQAIDGIAEMVHVGKLSIDAVEFLAVVTVARDRWLKMQVLA